MCFECARKKSQKNVSIYSQIFQFFSNISTLIEKMIKKNIPFENWYSFQEHRLLFYPILNDGTRMWCEYGLIQRRIAGQRRQMTHSFCTFILWIDSSVHKFSLLKRKKQKKNIYTELTTDLVAFYEWNKQKLRT